MRTLHLATTYPLHRDDSNAAFVESLVEALTARGHEMDVVVPWHPDLELRRPGRRARLHSFDYTPLRGWHPWGYAQALTGDRALRPDAYVAAVPAAWTSYRLLRKILSQGDVDVVHAHWLLPNAPVAAAAARRSRVPLVISCHGSGVFLAERHRWARPLAKRALRDAAAVTACSADLAARTGRFEVGPEPLRIPYGVDVARFRPLDEEERRDARDRLARRHGVPGEVPWVLAVGRLVHKKGFDRLIDAMPRLLSSVPQARVMIAGEGPLEEELRRRAAAAGVAGSLHLLGAVSHADTPRYYGAADVVAVPSVHGPRGNVDGLPNVLLEALASGRPVVASRVAGIPDVVRSGDNGILVEEGDAEGLGEALGRLLCRPERRRSLGAAARRRAEVELGWDRIAERFERLYERVVGRAGE